MSRDHPEHQARIVLSSENDELSSCTCEGRSGEVLAGDIASAGGKSTAPIFHLATLNEKG